VIVGVERAAPMTRRVAQMANFSNERSVDGGFRFLKNLTGLWLLERCRDQWPEATIEDLLARAADARGGIVVNTDDQHLFASASVAKTIAQMAELDVEDRGGVVRCILDSIAAATAGVLSQIGMVTGVPVTEVDIIGGGAHIPLLVELIGEACGLPCLVGSPESTALGNAKVQFDALVH
jgi:rhamnulokinase